MTALDTYGAALAAAEQAQERARLAAGREHAETVAKAKSALEKALTAHDEAMAAAEAKANTATEAARSAYQTAVADAERAFDSAKAAEHGARDAAVERRGGVLFLKAGRQVLATATPVGGGHWRITGEGGIVIVGEATVARGRLWDQVAAANEAA